MVFAWLSSLQPNLKQTTRHGIIGWEFSAQHQPKIAVMVILETFDTARGWTMGHWASADGSMRKQVKEGRAAADPVTS